jgi:hypothetical protein
MNVTPDRADTELSYGRAYEAWTESLERYLDLARRGASAAALREAAEAVNRAALAKGRLARDAETGSPADTAH